MKTIALVINATVYVGIPIINILIKSIVEKKKITAVTITHDMTSVNEYGEKVAFLKNGKIEWYGNAKKIYSTKNKNLKNFIEGVL